MSGTQAGRCRDESFGTVTSNGDLIVLCVSGGTYDRCFTSSCQWDDLGHVPVSLFLSCGNTKGGSYGMV